MNYETGQKDRRALVLVVVVQCKMEEKSSSSQVSLTRKGETKPLSESKNFSLFASISPLAMKNRAPPLRGVVHPHHTGLAPLPTYLHRHVAKKAKKQTEISTLVRYCWRRRLYLIFIGFKKKAAMLLLPGGGGHNISPN